jgi:hypothetical protein
MSRWMPVLTLLLLASGSPAAQGERIFQRTLTAEGSRVWSVQGWLYPEGSEIRVLGSGGGQAEHSYVLTFHHRIGRIAEAERVSLPGYAAPLLVTVWHEGARHQLLRIFDPSRKGSEGLLLELESSSTLSWKQAGRTLELEFYESDPDAPGGQAKLSKTWAPVRKR